MEENTVGTSGLEKGCCTELYDVGQGGGRRRGEGL
jgi:hypothetical protein